VLYQAVFMTAMSVPLALVYWHTPGVAELPFLAVIGALGTVSWLCMTRAFALVDASLVMPFEFARLPLTALVAWLLFAEVPTVWTWLGGVVIFGSTAYITHREIKAAAASRAAAKHARADDTARAALDRGFLSSCSADQPARPRASTGHRSTSTSPRTQW
jgi:drug/metabolite transporter (DMT)-like permease